MKDASRARPYRKRRRAIQEEETRRKITEVTVELHRTVGPANTTVKEIADRSGVSRMTVYNHFPTDEDLFAACSSHWIARHPFPDPASWSTVEDPGERLRKALRSLYRWYRAGSDMMGNVLRDAAQVPAVAGVLDDSWWPYLDRVVTSLARGSAARAPLRVAVDMGTWRILEDSGLDDDSAADLAARMVECADPRQD